MFYFRSVILSVHNNSLKKNLNFYSVQFLFQTHNVGFFSAFATQSLTIKKIYFYRNAGQMRWIDAASYADLPLGLQKSHFRFLDFAEFGLEGVVPTAVKKLFGKFFMTQITWCVFDNSTNFSVRNENPHAR